jgi:hypothetical protein
LIFTSKLADKGIEASFKDEDRGLFIILSSKNWDAALVNPSSKQRYLGIIQELIERGAEGVILGCTEEATTYSTDRCAGPVFDTAAFTPRPLLICIKRPKATIICDRLFLFLCINNTLQMKDIIIPVDFQTSLNAALYG